MSSRRLRPHAGHAPPWPQPLDICPLCPSDGPRTGHVQRLARRALLQLPRLSVRGSGNWPWESRSRFIGPSRNPTPRREPEGGWGIIRKRQLGVRCLLVKRLAAAASRISVRFRRDCGRLRTATRTTKETFHQVSAAPLKHLGRNLDESLRAAFRGGRPGPQLCCTLIPRKLVQPPDGPLALAQPLSVLPEQKLNRLPKDVCSDGEGFSRNCRSPQVIEGTAQLVPAQAAVLVRQRLGPAVHVQLRLPLPRFPRPAVGKQDSLGTQVAEDGAAGVTLPCIPARQAGRGVDKRFNNPPFIAGGFCIVLSTVTIKDHDVQIGGGGTACLGRCSRRGWPRRRRGVFPPRRRGLH